MNKDNIKRFIKISITLIFIIIILNKIDVYVLIQNFMGYPTGYMLMAFAINILVNLIGAFSLHAVYQKENVLSIFTVTLKSNFYAIALPGQLAGEATKVFLLSKEQSALSERISAVVVDKFLNAIAMIVLGAFGLLLSPNIQDAALQKVMIAGLMMIILVLLVLRSKRLLYFIWNKLKKNIIKVKWIAKGEEYLEIWLAYSNKNHELIISGIWGCVYQLMIALAYYVLGFGLGMKVSFWDYCWINAITTLILFLPVSIGGLGVREATLIGFLGRLNVDAEKAVTLSALMLGLQILRAAIGGVLLFIDRRSDLNEKNTNNKL